MKIPLERAPYDRIVPSLYLGALGATGQTAYYGMLTIGNLKDGENVFISGAAGATGCIAGQIAKLKRKNIYLVGSAGGENKTKWLIQDLKFDKALDYKKYGEDLNAMKAELKRLFPKGIDVYFDNTGGLITECVWDLLNPKARVVVCGQIARYPNISLADLLTPQSVGKIDDFLFKLIYKEIRIEGFTVYECKDWVSFYRDMKEWILKGQIKTTETMILGFDELPLAFEGLFTGKNVGKMIVKCKDEDLLYGENVLIKSNY